ncbi:hypothetical protein AB0K04_21700 [Micromonospora coxensis]|uniref:hypothetical protein n=1 Tax=Micromonospora coxensis TaxID=356852 RepID=UPI003413C43C
MINIASKSKQSKKEREEARNLALQRWALAHDAKLSAADRLTRLQADPNTSPTEITEATESLSQATTRYREAEAVARQFD